MPRLTPAQVRKALDQKYQGAVTFFRSPSGYYYFSGERGVGVPSLCQYTLEGYTLEEILQYVAEYVAEAID